MSRENTPWLSLLLGGILSAVVLALPLLPFVTVEMTVLEALAVVTSGWSVWLLARNNVSGWWIGIVGILLYVVVFFKVRLYGEVAIQTFYLLTSLYGIYVWHRGDTGQEGTVRAASARLGLLTLVAGAVGFVCLWWLLRELRGAVPMVDALTTTLSFIGQLYLLGRYRENWYIWIAVDLIYVPLYASRGLYLTSALYTVFLLVAVQGLLNFQRIYREERARDAGRFHTAS